MTDTRMTGMGRFTTEFYDITGIPTDCDGLYFEKVKKSLLFSSKQFDRI